MQLAHVRQPPGLRLSIRLAAGVLRLRNLCAERGAVRAVTRPRVGEGKGEGWGGRAPTLLSDTVHHGARAEGQDVRAAIGAPP